MMIRLSIKFFSVLFFALLFISTTAVADSNENAISVFKKSPAVQPYFSSAYGYAVFPAVYKAGIVVGGASGTGKVYKGGVATGTSTLGQVSLGFQLGFQVFSQIIFFEDERAYTEFTKDNFEFDANVSVVVITAAAQAKVGSMGTTAGASAGPATGSQVSNQYRKGYAVFVQTKGGLMFEAVAGGQQFQFEPYE
jgi:lipid-binding SYLF domain-containing protein